MKIKILYQINKVIYVASNICYEIQKIRKIGRTINIDTRINGYNTGLLQKDKFSYVYTFQTDYPIELEQLIFKTLEKYKVENEMYKLELSKIKTIIELLNQNIINEKYISQIL